MGKLGDHHISKRAFDGVDTLIKPFLDSSFSDLNEHDRYDLVGKTLLEAILGSSSDFVLPEVVDFISRVQTEGHLDGYSMSAFETWLNHFSLLSDDKNYAVRGKIMGRYVPRDAYQVFFPIGMGKKHRGTHFVVGHSSPDLDTTVASFWGWVDAFAARVSDGLHVWNVPGGPPATQVEVELLFEEVFGKGLYENVVKTRSVLGLTALDLLTQEGLTRKGLHEPAISADHERDRNAVVLVDEKGYFLGDWRSIDVEGVRGVVTSLNNCLRWLEGHFHVALISLFAQEELKLSDIPNFLYEFLSIKIKECEPAKDFTFRQEKYLQDYLVKVLGVSQGLDASFEELATGAAQIADFKPFLESLEEMRTSKLFDKQGTLIENRPKIFHLLEKIVSALSKVVMEMRAYADKLDVALKIKTDVFGFHPQFLSYRTDLDDIRAKIRPYTYLTVNYANEEGKELPVGVVYASDLQHGTLGTVSLRDFCNREETKVPSYLEIISVVDHHKSHLITKGPARAVISDMQSSNSILAGMTFQINDRYSTGGMSEADVDAQLKAPCDAPSDLRIQTRLLQKKMIFKEGSDYAVSPKREFLEYLQFLYAIIDDTDLLTKVSSQDVEVIRDLLNRMRSIMEKKEVEIVHFDDIAHGSTYAREAAKKLLQNDDFYSLYAKVYREKEKRVSLNLESGDIFSDTKLLGHVSRVGQTKIFVQNLVPFEKHAASLRTSWLKNAEKIYAANQEIDLHIQMISTVTSAEEVHKGKSGEYAHFDELWLYAPETDLGAEHLQSFLNSFASAIKMPRIEIHLPKTKKLGAIFKEAFPHTPPQIDQELPVAILKYPAGLLNSRKSQIAPHLP